MPPRVVAPEPDRVPTSTANNWGSERRVVRDAGAVAEAAAGLRDGWDVAAGGMEPGADPAGSDFGGASDDVAVPGQFDLADDEGGAVVVLFDRRYADRGFLLALGQYLDELLHFEHGRTT